MAMKSYNSRWSSTKNYSKPTEAAPSRPKSAALEDLPDPDGGGETMTDTTSQTPVTKLRQTKSAIWELSDNMPDEPDQPPNPGSCVVRGKVREMVRLFDRNLRTDEELPDPANDSESAGARASQTFVAGSRPTTPNERSPSPAPPTPTPPTLAPSTSGRPSAATTAPQEEQEDPTETQTTKGPAKRSILRSSSKGSLPRPSDRSTFQDRTVDPNDDQSTNTTYFDSTGGNTRDSRRTEHPRSSSRSSSRQRQPPVEIKARWDRSPPKRDGPISATTKPTTNTKYPRTTTVNYSTSRTAAHTRSFSRNKSSEDLQIQIVSKTTEKATRVDAVRIQDTTETEIRDVAENLPNERVTQGHEQVSQNPVGWTARCYQLPLLVFHGMFMVVSIPASWIWNRIPTWKTTGLKQQDNNQLGQSDTSPQTNP